MNTEPSAACVSAHTAANNSTDYLSTLAGCANLADWHLASHVTDSTLASDRPYAATRELCLRATSADQATPVCQLALVKMSGDVVWLGPTPS